MNRKSSLTEIKGIGEKTKQIFEKAGVNDIGSLLSYYPRTYQKYEELSDSAHAVEGEMLAIYGQIEKAVSVQYVKRLQIVSTVVRDASGFLQVRWYNMPFLKNTIKPGASYVFYGKVAKKGSRLLLEQPALFDLTRYRQMLCELQPVYALTKGLTNHMIRKAVRQALDAIDLTKDYLSSEIRKKYRLAEYGYAVEEIHFPKDEHHMSLARRRLVFDEFFLFLLALRQYKERRELQPNHFEIERRQVTEEVIGHLPYALTSAQKKVWEEIQRDMTGKSVMARLIQGDVGSGKTIVAFLAMILAAANGLQSSIMVPTEVLARQHFEALQSLLAEQNLEYTPVLLTGSMTAKEKRQAREKIAGGEADMIVGTHALIQENVIYKKMGLVITDEQHRFGVKQRETLGNKGGEPHTLVMSATPIPRTLAVILYGDLEISVIDELPANRIPIKNCIVNTNYRPKAYAFIEKEVRNGHQAYIICPMAEESEMIEAEDVLSYTKRLKEQLPPDICVEYLHGKMKPKEKNEIMERFLKNEIQVLVSTTVVEVGVNVANATVMMIENAERFGLAQLHQLRGRVGRSSYQSYCIMINGSENKKNQKRLDILNQSNDGFYIASEDLKLRGPGDLLGVRQSGMMEFKIGDVFADADILRDANEAVHEILETDPELTLPQHIVLRQKLEYYMSNELKNLNL